VRILYLNARTVVRAAIGQENVQMRQKELLAFCAVKTLMTRFHAPRKFALNVTRLVISPLIVLKQISLNAIGAVSMDTKR
jgi:hypothetical protein